MYEYPLFYQHSMFKTQTFSEREFVYPDEGFANDLSYLLRLFFIPELLRPGNWVGAGSGCAGVGEWLVRREDIR